ncbi:hypothetical protein Q9G87_57220 [Nonomuraea sp. G32]|nr:hypothetical protein [Nonomuraea sp. G32]MDP4511560.1 hypothetical protein [Nonomuraea sp. G32]
MRDGDRLGRRWPRPSQKRPCAGGAAGARSAGRMVVSILSRADREQANPDLSIVIPTGVGEARNSIIVSSGDAVIAVGGSWDTLSEVSFAMRRGDIPVVQLGGWRLLDQDGRLVPGIRYAASPEEARTVTGLW